MPKPIVMRRALLLVVLLSVAAGASFMYPFPRQVCLRRADLVVLGHVVSELPGPDFCREPSRFMHITPSLFSGRPNRNRTPIDSKLGVLQVDRWLKGAPREKTEVIYPVEDSYLDHQTSVWLLQWNEGCKAYQFDHFFGPTVEEVPLLEKTLKEQAEQVFLDDHHGVKYWIQPLDSLDGFGRDVEIETVLEGDLSQVRLEVSVDGRPVEPKQLNDFRWGFISVPRMGGGDHTILVNLLNGPYRTTAGPFIVTVER